MIELVIGQQSTAAQTVAEAATTYQQAIQSLADDLQTQASGFSGQAASGFAEAVGAWFEVAVRVGPALEGYATALAGVDADHARNEGTQVERYGALGGRLGDRLGDQP